LLNQPVTFTAIVAVGPTATGTPGGTVTFYDGNKLLAQNILLVDGQAQITTSTLALGSHAISAVYSGDTSWDGSSSAAVSVGVLYQFVGFSQPVNNNGVLNLATVGQSIPPEVQSIGLQQQSGNQPAQKER
jgi:hypothetical protein